MSKHEIYLTWLGLIEGGSLLLILFVCMPLKYLFGIPEPTKVVGMAHGILFLMYLASLVAAPNEIFTKKYAKLVGAVCSVVPFGPFWFHARYMRRQK